MRLVALLALVVGLLLALPHVRAGAADSSQSASQGAAVVFVTKSHPVDAVVSAADIVSAALQCARLPSDTSYVVSSRTQLLVAGSVSLSTWRITVAFTSNYTANLVYALRSNATALALMQVTDIALPAPPTDVVRGDRIGPLAVAVGVTVGVVCAFLAFFAWKMWEHTRETPQPENDPLDQQQPPSFANSTPAVAEYSNASAINSAQGGYNSTESTSNMDASAAAAAPAQYNDFSDPTSPMTDMNNPSLNPDL